MTTHSTGERSSRPFKRSSAPGPARAGGRTRTGAGARSSSGAFRAGGFSDRRVFSRGASRPGGARSAGGFSGGSRFGGSSRGGFSRGGGRSRFGGNRNRNKGSNIDISKFIHTPDESYQEVVIPVKHTFADFNLSEPLQKNLAHKKFVTPTPIQDQAIPHLLEGKDLIGLANTGTGKTGAFLLPTIEKIYRNPKSKCLVLAPTRELATQIDAEFRQFVFGMKMYSTVCVGGMPIGRQIRSLGMLNHLIIGTPGRVKDLIERGVLKLDDCDTVVLDECDRMLDMGFIDDIKTILKQLPDKRQSLLFSATMPPEIKKLVSQFTHDPVTVDIKTGTTTKNIAQDIVRVGRDESKVEKLDSLLKDPEMNKVIIFAETKREVDQLARELRAKGFRVGHIHGDKRQRERDRTLQEFKNHQTTILIATDVAARGIDVKDVSHVINYTIPQTYEDYTHRIGRTGRGGKSGKALTFVH